MFFEPIAMWVPPVLFRCDCFILLFCSVSVFSFLVFVAIVSRAAWSFRKTLSRIIWVEIDPESGFKRVIARDGEKVKTEMLNFLKDQNKHFSAELTDKAADYTISGVP